MKKIFLIGTILCWTIEVFAQEPITPIVLSEVIQVENSSKDNLFDKARLFLVNAFNDPKEVIQLSDKETGTLVAKGIVQIQNKSWNNIINFTFSIFCKDGRYKYEINNIGITYRDARGELYDYGMMTTDNKPTKYVSSFMKNAQNQNYMLCKEKSLIKFESLINGLKETMQAPSSTNNDNW